jgi:hypothetical protein
MAEDGVWHEPGRSVLAGDYKRPEGVLELLRNLQDRSDGTFKVEVVDLLANPERAVAIQQRAVRQHPTRSVPSICIAPSESGISRSA